LALPDLNELGILLSFLAMKLHFADAKSSLRIAWLLPDDAHLETKWRLKAEK
jgi:hypothetical protein